MKLLRLLLVPFALLCVAFVRLAWPRWKIRFGALMASRLGHLAGNTEVYLCERAAGQHKGFTDLWIAEGEVCNRPLMKMLRRVLPIGGVFLRTVVLCNKLFAGWEKHEVPSGDLDRDPQNLMEKYPPRLWFSFREQLRGEQMLRGMGIPEGARFVCLIVRDSAYLPELGYHSYRDANIDDYLPACIALANRGYYVIRMGAKVNKAMAFYTDKIIDYATNGMRSEFMDVYLGANCAFCVSSGCGFDAVPYIFRRPICYTNYVPLEYLLTFAPKSLAIWKHHEKDGKRMTPAEIYASGAGQFMRADEFAEAGITLVDNTPEEIRAVVEEMAAWDEFLRRQAIHRLERDVPEHSDQSAFWQSFPRSVSPYTDGPLHGEIRMRIGREFLKSYLPQPEK